LSRGHRRVLGEYERSNLKGSAIAELGSPLDAPPSLPELAELQLEFALARGPMYLAPMTDKQKWAEFELNGSTN
jgi:hypothetical protein